MRCRTNRFSLYAYAANQYWYLIRCFGVKYHRLFLRVVLYSDEPAGRVKIQTTRDTNNSGLNILVNSKLDYSDYWTTLTGRLTSRNSHVILRHPLMFRTSEEILWEYFLPSKFHCHSLNVLGVMKEEAGGIHPLPWCQKTKKSPVWIRSSKNYDALHTLGDTDVGDDNSNNKDTPSKTRLLENGWQEGH